jgi:hypothetical protein
MHIVADLRGDTSFICMIYASIEGILIPMKVCCHEQLCWSSWCRFKTFMLLRGVAWQSGHPMGLISQWTLCRYYYCVWPLKMLCDYILPSLTRVATPFIWHSILGCFGLLLYMHYVILNQIYCICEDINILYENKTNRHYFQTVHISEIFEDILNLVTYMSWKWTGVATRAFMV